MSLKEPIFSPHPLQLYMISIKFLANEKVYYNLLLRSHFQPLSDPKPSIMLSSSLNQIDSPLVYLFGMLCPSSICYLCRAGVELILSSGVSFLRPAPFCVCTDVLQGNGQLRMRKKRTASAGGPGTVLAVL